MSPLRVPLLPLTIPAGWLGRRLGPPVSVAAGQLFPEGGQRRSRVNAQVAIIANRRYARARQEALAALSVH